ncbi:hypothetical protein CA850_10955 [Micromonospora echinospora]|uniref:Uncharacterized protein n=1 Tax=Micromonospora echinospora TaxID=1877 RepID=A0A1C4ZQ58_MICEC|nr:hypothetical protein [Micromonospora echinospora]OZV81673.1 hypothetical protein CA850_10955 [Micromonospora echinospora]SCF35039.1 hypothetical protein GA0070618_5585 [Micromonospora echinospora]
MFFRFSHRNWVKTTGKLLDSRVHSVRNSDVRWAYIVQFPGPKGQHTKLEVLEDSRTLGVAVSATVPRLVSPDGKKAVFDRSDPQINAAEVVKRHEKADEERFRRQLGD